MLFFGMELLVFHLFLRKGMYLSLRLLSFLLSIKILCLFLLLSSLLGSTCLFQSQKLAVVLEMLSPEVETNKSMTKCELQEARVHIKRMPI